MKAGIRRATIGGPLDEGKVVVRNWRVNLMSWRAHDSEYP